MRKSCYTNKNEQPTELEIANSLGSIKEHWNSFSEYLSLELKLKGEFKFYGVNYGWAKRYVKSGKSVIALYPDKECFTAQIILNKNQVDSALELDLEASIKDTIKNTESIYEGKWIFIKIEDEILLEDIKKLVAVRLRIK